MKTLEYEHVVIGGGFAGLHCSSKLAQAGHTVAVLERREELMAEASRNNFARIHHGWHYPGSLDTAFECIPAAFEFIADFGDLLIHDPHGGPARGWCALSNDSFTEAGEWLRRASAMQEVYTATRSRYTRDFGSPAEFFNVLARPEWEAYIDPSRVSLTASTSEAFVDLPALRERVLTEAYDQSRVTIFRGHCVSRAIPIQNRRGGEAFELHVATSAGNITVCAQHVLNASWAFRHMLDPWIASAAPREKTTYRLKTFLKVVVPEKIIELPSLLVVHGPFMTYTRCGDGTGIIDYAPVSNHDTSVDVVPESWKPMLHGEFSESESRRIAQATLEGASRYVPGFRDAKVIEISAGVLSHPGHADIYDQTSALHHRLHTGLKRLLPNWISLDTGKLSWVPRYANELVAHYAARSTRSISPVPGLNVDQRGLRAAIS